MYRIKQLDEDFFVKEDMQPKLKPKGRFLYFILRKRNWSSQDAVEKLAMALNISDKRFSYAGQKDKNAVTEQYVAIENLAADRLGLVKIRDISVKFLGYSDRPISLGSVQSNNFTIIVRNLEKPVNEINSFCNYYDDQRFGGIRPINAIIGKHILRKEFEDAVKRYLCYPFEGESREHKDFRINILKNWGDFRVVKIPGYLRNEKKVLDCLSSSPKNYIGALKIIPKRISTMFIQSYQSLLFNKLLSDYVRKNNDGCYRVKTNVGYFHCTDDYFDKKFPLPGYDATDIASKNILKEEGIDKECFKVKEIPYLSSRTTHRQACIKLDNVNYGKLADDELNSGKKKQQVSFSLPSGSYATFVIKCMAHN